jgi:hypothetical protein
MWRLAVLQEHWRCSLHIAAQDFVILDTLLFGVDVAHAPRQGRAVLKQDSVHRQGVRP